MKQGITFSSSSWPTLVIDAETIATIELTSDFKLEIFTKDGFKRQLPFGDAFTAMATYTALRIVLFENDESIMELLKKCSGNICNLAELKALQEELKEYQQQWKIFSVVANEQKGEQS